jgi:hypothetical protein
MTMGGSAALVSNSPRDIGTWLQPQPWTASTDDGDPSQPNTEDENLAPTEITDDDLIHYLPDSLFHHDDAFG